ncbi:MAG: hypothetical protein ACK4XJ_09640 [Fimbriimonadaceae bacterium]
MLTRFVVCADEVARLQRGTDPESRFAQGLFEKGHYAGRTQPTDTRQGTYVSTPSGAFLASWNTNDPRRVADGLRLALERWNAMSESERMNPNAEATAPQVVRFENLFPKDGLVLRVFSRDLPREHTNSDWRSRAWNQDYAWFRKDEARGVMPEEIAPGAEATWPDLVTHRLVRLNFVDNVRGQVSSFRADAIRSAVIKTEVISVENGVAQVQFFGRTEANTAGVWPVADRRDAQNPTAQRRGMKLSLYGTGRYDIKAARFTEMELLALGTRYGGTQYNGRHDDLEPGPIGFFLTLAGDRAVERVAPSFYYEYGWSLPG